MIGMQHKGGNFFIQPVIGYRVWRMDELKERLTGVVYSNFVYVLKKGERPAAALREAQVEMWLDKRWGAPYYWAAFTLQGEWR